MKLKEIKDIITDEIRNLTGLEVKDLDEDVFFKTNAIDSLSMLNLIVFLEEKFKVEIDAFYVDREAVSSVNRLAGAIEKKRKKGN